MNIYKPILISFFTFFLLLIPWVIILEIRPSFFMLQISLKDFMDIGLIVYILKGLILQLTHVEVYSNLVLALMAITLLSFLCWEFKLVRVLLIILGVIAAVFVIILSFGRCEGLGCLGLALLSSLDQIILLFVFSLIPIILIKIKNSPILSYNTVKFMLLSFSIYCLVSIGSLINKRMFSPPGPSELSREDLIELTDSFILPTYFPPIVEQKKLDKYFIRSSRGIVSYKCKNGGDLIIEERLLKKMPLQKTLDPLESQKNIKDKDYIVKDIDIRGFQGLMVADTRSAQPDFILYYYTDKLFVNIKLSNCPVLSPKEELIKIAESMSLNR